MIASRATLATIEAAAMLTARASPPITAVAAQLRPRG